MKPVEWNKTQVDRGHYPADLPKTMYVKTPWYPLNSSIVLIMMPKFLEKWRWLDGKCIGKRGRERIGRRNLLYYVPLTFQKSRTPPRVFELQTPRIYANASDISMLFPNQDTPLQPLCRKQA